MAIYLGDEKNLARKILKFYIGDENGVARKVTKAYIGDANGVARLFYTAHTHAYISNDDYTFDTSVSVTQHWYTKSCECGDTITEWEDHEFRTYYQPPTCTEDGFEDEECICGYGDSRTLPATGHTEVIFTALEPTCVQGGNTEGSYCSVCGEWLVRTEPLDPLGHNWIDATCTEPATCTRCGATSGVALGHDWEYTGIDEGEASGGVNEIFECTRCGEIDRRQKD